MGAFQGRRAIVTGGAVRIGRAIAMHLAAGGAEVCVHYGQSASAAQLVVEQIRASGGRAVALPADLNAAAETVGPFFAQVSAALGEIDILINSASIFEPDTLDALTAEHCERHWRINLLAPLLMSQAFARQLGSDRRGHIINIVDWRAARPKPGHLAYTVSKAGLVAVTKMLAQELAPRIQVNAIAPGAILPPAAAAPDYEVQAISRVPLRRLGHPAEITRAVEYLLNSQFVHGEVLHVTGGEQL